MARRNSAPSISSESSVGNFKRQNSDPEGRKIAEPKQYQETNPPRTVNSNLVVDRNGPIPGHIQRCTTDRLQRRAEASRSSRGDPSLEEATFDRSYFSPPNLKEILRNHDNAELVCGGHSPPCTDPLKTPNRAQLAIAGLDLSKESQLPDPFCDLSHLYPNSIVPLVPPEGTELVCDRPCQPTLINIEDRSLPAVPGLELNNDTHTPGANSEWHLAGYSESGSILLYIDLTELPHTKIGLRIRRGASLGEVNNHPLLTDLRERLLIDGQKELHTEEGTLLHPLHRFTDSCTLQLR